MKTPVVYKIADNLRCLLAEDGQKISIGSAAECDVQIKGDAVHDVETTVQFVNECQSVRILSSNGGAPHEQSLPWTIPLAGFDLVFYRPFSPVDIPEVSIEREITLHGLTDGKTRHVLKAHQPLLLGSSEDCDLVNSSADCPVVQLALWATVDNKVAVEVLDNSSVVDWLGRANATKAEMELPASLSLGGKIICIVNSDKSSSTQLSAPALTPAGPPRILPPLSGGTHNHPTLVGAAGQWVVVGRRLVDAARQWLVRDRRLTPQIVVSTNIVAPETASSWGVIIASWILIVLLCGGAFIPGLGFGTWALVWPFMLMTFILGIIALARRATVQGLMILLATILVVPAVIFVAPFLSTFVARAAVGTAQKTVGSVPELQQSLEQLGKSIKVVQDLSHNAKIVTDPLKRLSTTDPQEWKSADLSKGPQSNVNASTAPRSTDDSSGTMAEQPISNENQGSELPVLATELPSVFEADGSIKLADNYIIKPLGAREDAHIKATQVMLRGLLDTYGTKKLFSITNKPAQGDITIVLTVNGRGVKDANTLEEAIFKARETKRPLVFQVTSRMGGGIGTQIGPSAIDLILGAAAVDMQIKPENSQTMLAVSSVDLQGGNGLVRTDIEKSHGYMLPIGKSPFQPPNVDRREFISTLLPNIMGDQLVAVGYSEGSFSVNGERNPQSKRIALHRALDNVEWYDQWLIGAKARDTNYEWDDSENWTLHPAGGVSNPNYESLLEQTRVASDGIPRNSFVECVVNDVAVMRETEVHIAGVTEANGKIWFAPLALFSPSQQRYMKKEYWRLMPNCSSLHSALAKNDLFAKICANEYRFVDHNILQEAAAKGDPDALNVLGRCYLEGVCYGDLLEKTGEGNIARWLPRRVDVPKDALKAVELLKAAAEKGNIDACIALGEYLSKQADQEHLGRLYYLIAAYVGHPLAHLNLALEYRNMKNAISNVTDEQRARRAVWHLLCAVNCNREFMSLRVGGETVRVMCYDLAGDMLDSLEDSLLREYAKIEMQKLKMPWPMKWDRTAADNATGILASAEELQHEIDNYLKSGASSSNGGADLSKGPQSNVDASTAPRSTDDSSGTMAEQPISNENQRPELPVNASNQMPVVEKSNKTNEQQALEDFQREANKLAESLRKDAATRPTILQTYLEDAPKISFSTRQPGLLSNEICAIAHYDGYTPKLFFGDEFYNIDSEVRDPNFRIGAAAKSPLGILIKRVGDVMGFDRMKDTHNVLGNLMLHSPRIADQNIRTEALKKSEVFRGVVIGDDALSVITQIFKSNSFIYDKTFRLLGSQISYALNSIIITTTTKVFDEYCTAVFIFVPPNEFEDADFVKNISSLKSYRLVGLEINLMGQDEAQRVFNEYFKKAMYGKTEMVWTTSDRELLKSLGLGAFLEKQDLQSLNQAAETIEDAMKLVNAMNAERNRSAAFLDQFKMSAQSKYHSLELKFEDISWQYSSSSGITYYCKNKFPQMTFSFDHHKNLFSKDGIISVTTGEFDGGLRFYHNALLIQNDASSVMRDCIDDLQSKIDEDERKLKNTRNGDFK